MGQPVATAIFSLLKGIKLVSDHAKEGRVSLTNPRSLMLICQLDLGAASDLQSGNSPATFC